MDLEKLSKKEGANKKIFKINKKKVVYLNCFSYIYI